MRRAIALSRRGLPAPNPHVGCVIVRNGEVVGEGWHRYAGGLHAEAEALLKAGDRAQGAEVYCTLEPCNHTGRQPACSAALQQAQVKRIWFACGDPNPRVAGGGGEALRKAGLEVQSGLLEAEAATVNQTWLRAMALTRPFVTLKAAMTLDGRIALPNGESQWITSERARRAARRLRAEMGAVLVGAGTVVRDDPHLTARIRGLPNEPLRIVLDPQRRLSDTARAFLGPGRCLRGVGAAHAQDGDLALPLVADRFDLHAMLRRLWDEGLTGILVEGGGATLSSFLEAGLADRLDLFMGNAIFGQGPSWIQGPTLARPSDAGRWQLVRLRRFENDVWLRYAPMS